MGKKSQLLTGFTSRRKMCKGKGEYLFKFNVIFALLVLKIPESKKENQKEKKIKLNCIKDFYKKKNSK
jgi:hypothetical protein